VEVVGLRTLGGRLPLLADLIGLDALLYILDREIGDRYRPCPFLRRMVRANRLGRKTGHGVYCYTKF
jgi:3-hydroxybutyryl-CoA dehydrogenase